MDGFGPGQAMLLKEFDDEYYPKDNNSVRDIIMKKNYLDRKASVHVINQMGTRLLDNGWTTGSDTKKV